MVDQIILALIAGGVITEIVRGVFSVWIRRIDWSQKRKKAEAEKTKRFYNVFELTRKIYKWLDELKSEINCVRVLILYAADGGGLPRVGSPMYATILFETFDRGRGSMLNDWDRRRVDHEYNQVMLIGTETSGEGVPILVSTDNLNDGLLKDTYLNDGIKSALCAKIKHTDDRYYYISCHFNRKLDIAESDSKRFHIRNICHKLSQALEHEDKLVEDMENGTRGRRSIRR